MRTAIKVSVVLLSASLAAATAKGGAQKPQPSKPPTRPSQALVGIGITGSTCTSSNGKNTCVCQEKCQATESSCSCFGVLPPKKPNAADLPLAAAQGAQKATCTSGDGKKACTCGDAGCSASSKNCQCATAPSP